jgi:hypothetical protein
MVTVIQGSLGAAGPQLNTEKRDSIRPPPGGLSSLPYMASWQAASQGVPEPAKASEKQDLISGSVMQSFVI